MPSAKERCEPLRYHPLRLLSWQLPYHQPPLKYATWSSRNNEFKSGANPLFLPCKVWHNFSLQSPRPGCRCRRQTWRRECHCDCTKSRQRFRKTSSGKSIFRRSYSNSRECQILVPQLISFTILLISSKFPHPFKIHKVSTWWCSLKPSFSGPSLNDLYLANLLLPDQSSRSMASSYLVEFLALVNAQMRMFPRIMIWDFACS